MAKFHKSNNLYPTPLASGIIYLFNKIILSNNWKFVKCLILTMDLTGLEPAISAVTGQRDNQLRYVTKFHHASVFLDPAGFEPATLKGLTPMLWSIIFSYRCVPFAWKIGIASYQKTRLTIWWINGARWNRTTDTQGFNLLLYLTELSRLNIALCNYPKRVHRFSY